MSIGVYLPIDHVRLVAIFLCMEATMIHPDTDTTTDDSDDLIPCPTCDGSGVVEHGDHDDDACPTCMGDGAIEPGSEVCEPAEGDTPHGICDDDGEPGDIDSDENFNPYTGSADDDGYDTGCFDDGCFGGEDF
jgi:hypothetical protein